VTVKKPKAPKAPTKTEIARDLAQKIDVHLKRFERDPKINPGKRYDDKKRKWVPDSKGVRDYYCAGAGGDRHRVWVRYITYQGGRHLSIEEAQKYLAWLDAGNVGRHYEAIREAS
jgi:hypothetical protein